MAKERSTGAPKSKVTAPASLKGVAQPGDRVLITCTDEALTGTLMPSEDPSIVVLKLESGYNIGIEAKRVRTIETQPGTPKKTPPPHEPAVHKKGLPTISILHTGGTIASKVDYSTGGVIARFTPEELLELFPEVGKIANLRSRLLANMWSEDMRFAHYRIMARAIEEEIKKGCDGIIITHGTDTLHYSAAALAFILDGAPVPILLVGAQRSSDRGSSDAGMNLISAATFIAKTDYCGVAICMHMTSEDRQCAILPPTKTRKNHSSRRDAFQAVGCDPIALVEPETAHVRFLRQDYDKKDSKRTLTVLDKMEEKVALLKLHPNMIPEQFSIFLKLGYKGLVLEGMGLGQAPTGVPNPEAKIHEKNRQAIADLIDSGCIVTMTSQTITGRVHMHVYSKAIELSQMGVVGCEDMTPETAFIKLAWLLGNHKPDEAKKLMTQNLRGEITVRSTYEETQDHAIHQRPAQ